MANNKIQLATGLVLLDLTADTVDAAHLASGYTAHDMSGAIITGTMNVPTATDAVLIATVPAGSTVTMTKGQTSLTPTLWTTAADSSRECALFVIPSALFDSQNAWTVTATSGSNTASQTFTIDSAKQYEAFLSFDIYIIRNGQLQSGYTLEKGQLRELSQQGTYVYANYSSSSSGGNGSIGSLSNNDKQYLVMVASEATVAANSAYQGWGINDNTTSGYNTWFVASRFPTKLTNAPGMWYIDVSNVNQSLAGRYVKIQLGSSAGAAHLNITQLYFTDNLPT